MKTPFEMLEYALSSEERAAKAFNAMWHNEKGFRYIAIALDWIKVEGSRIDVLFPSSDSAGDEGSGKTVQAEHLSIDMADEETLDILRHADPSNTRTYLIKFKDQFNLLAVSYEDEDEEELDSAALTALLVEFLALAGIDTEEKLDAVIERGWELRQEANDAEERRKKFMAAHGPIKS